MCPSYLLCIHSFLIQPCITYFGSLSKHTQFRALGQLNYEERVAQIRTLTYYRWSFCLTRSRAAYHVTNVTKVYGERESNAITCIFFVSYCLHVQSYLLQWFQLSLWCSPWLHTTTTTFIQDCKELDRMLHCNAYVQCS